MKQSFVVFDEIVAREKIQHLGLGHTVDATCIPPLFSRIEKGTLATITLGGMPLSGSLATDISEKLLNLGVESLILFLREDYCPEVIHAFRHFFQESSVSSLPLVLCRRDDWISTEALQSICSGVLNSSVTFLLLHGIKVRGDNVKQVYKILADIILDSSSSIEKIQVKTGDLGNISLPLLSRALRQHPFSQNLSITFRTEGQDNALFFYRNPWWKRLLAMDDLPPSLWPLLLEKADTWKREASHSNLDVLYYLLKEKNSELLQNVRRRRIRKRKRYGFSA